MPDILRDVRHALRGLRGSATFTAVAVLSIAIGVGANTAIFTLLDQVLLRRLPVNRPDELVLLTSRGPHYGNNQGGNALSYAMYEDFRDALVARDGRDPGERVSETVIGREVTQPIFAGIFGRFATGMVVSVDGRSERVTGELVSGTFFSVLGVGVIRGRTITPDDDRRPGEGAVAVLSHGYWQRRFGGDESIVGQTIRVNTHPLRVIGVSEPGFFGVDLGYSPDIRVPMMMKAAMTPGWDALDDRRSRWLNVFGRLAPQVTTDAAKAALQTVFQRILEVEVTQPAFRTASAETKAEFLRMTPDVLPGSQGRAPLRTQLSQPLSLLMALVAGVLLIACANVAGLLVARAAARQREIAVRVALGARRWQVMRPLLVESLLLGLGGGALGVALSFWATGFLLAFLLPPNSPAILSGAPDLRVLLFALTLSVASSLLFGVLPALGASGRVRVGLLGERARAGGGVTFRKALVVAQVALSLLLLVGAGLFIRSLRELRNIDLGMRTEDVVTFRASPFASGYTAERSGQFYRDVLDRLRARPRVTAVGLAAMGVLEGSEWDSTITVQGYTPAPGEDRNPYCNAVSPGYFTALGMPLRMGRDFTASDAWRPGDSAPPGGSGDGFLVAIANERFVKHYFGAGNPIGRRIGFGRDPGTPTPIEIVGVVADAKYTGVRDEVPEQLFFPFFQGRNATAGLIYVRAAERAESLVGAIRDTVQEVDPNIPVFSLRTLEDKADRSLVNERLIATLSGAFSVVATMLAVVGLYGVMSYTVTQRTREVGIRVALGAVSRQVLWLVTREAAVLVLLGVAIGVAGAVALSRVVETLLYGVAPRDPVTIAIAAMTLALVGLLAGLGPARRASRLDPVRALREE